jgi:hypothetical protein
MGDSSYGLLVATIACRLVCASAASTDQTILIVCVQEGTGFQRDPDRPRLTSNGHDLFNIQVSNGQHLFDNDVDAFVSVVVGNEIMSTSVQAMNDNTPVWNECFEFKGSHDATTPVVLIAADADLKNDDDEVGSACTNAVTGTRWLDLSGPDGKLAGRIRVQIVHLTVDSVADRAQEIALGFQSIESDLSPRPSSRGAVAKAQVSCPAGQRLVACQCWSLTGEPGCATTRMEHDTCFAESEPYEPFELAPACEVDADGTIHLKKDCSPPNWHIPPPRGIRASGRCVKADAFTSIIDVASSPSLDLSGDAVAAACAHGQNMLGCSVSGGDGRQTGARYGFVGDVAEPYTTTPTCIAQSGASGTPTVALARCGSVPVDDATHPEDKLVSISLVQQEELSLKHVHLHTELARCPQPFAIVGCTCFSHRRGCQGAQFRDGFGKHACEVSVKLESAGITRKLVWTPPGYAFANCIWRGKASRLIANSAMAVSSCAAARLSSQDQWTHEVRNATRLSKAWLPEGMRARLREHRAQMESTARLEALDDHVCSLRSVSSFFIGILSTMISCCMLLCVSRCKCTEYWRNSLSKSSVPWAQGADDGEGGLLDDRARSDAPSHISDAAHRSHGVEAVPLSDRSGRVR